MNLCCCADQCFNRSRNATESRLSREDSEALKEIKSVYEGHCKKLQIAPKPKVYKAIKRGIKKMRKRQKKSLKQQGSPRSRMYPFRKQRSRPMFLPSQNSRTSEDLDIHSMTSETDASFLTTSSTMTTSTVSSVVNVGGQVHNIPIDAAMLEMKSMDINDEDLIAICAALKSKVCLILTSVSKSCLMSILPLKVVTKPISLIHSFMHSIGAHVSLGSIDSLTKFNIRPWSASSC